VITLHVRSDVHLIGRPEVRETERWLRRRFPDFGDRLFVYYHRVIGNYVVAYWVSRDRRKALEVAVLGPSPRLTSDVLDRITRILCAPVTRRDILLTIQADERQQARRMEESRAVRKEVRQRIIHDWDKGGPRTVVSFSPAVKTATARR